METLEDVLLEADDKMSKSLEVLRQQFSGLRTGKASPTLVENISVSHYGTTMRLREIAGIAIPEPRLIVITPYDPTALQPIEKAIVVANIGITPLSDGRVIRLPIPELSEERRREMAKVAKQMAEKCRVAIRAVRQEANEQTKALQKKGVISEDVRDQGLKDIQKYTDDAVAKADAAFEAKEKEMMTV